MIYLVLNEFRSAVKIGYADTLTGAQRRILNFQIANVDKLEILCIIDGTQNEELRLHRVFKRFRRRGEWFHDCEEIRAHFAQFQDFYSDTRERLLKRKELRTNRKHKKYERWKRKQEEMKRKYERPDSPPAPPAPRVARPKKMKLVAQKTESVTELVARHVPKVDQTAEQLRQYELVLRMLEELKSVQ